MMNLLNNPQEEIQWVENESSALVILNTHIFKKGEIYVVGYLTGNGRRDVLVGLGIDDGSGPSNYRILVEKGTCVVYEVLDGFPDVSYYSFNQRYLINGGDGNYYLTRKYLDQAKGETVFERFKVKDSLYVIEASTGDIWLCNPPSLVNLFELASKAYIDSLEVDGSGNVVVSITSGGNTHQSLSFVTPSERSFLKKKAFEDEFEVGISVAKIGADGEVDTIDPCKIKFIKYTIETRYGGELVDLDKVPDGWTKESTGRYFAQFSGYSYIESPQGTCTYTNLDGYTGSKEIPSITTKVGGYFFISFSSSSLVPQKLMLITDPSEVGRITVAPPEGNKVKFFFPVSLPLPKEITQIGLTYVKSEVSYQNNITRDGVNLGRYVIYESINSGNGLSQEIVVK